MPEDFDRNPELTITVQNDGTVEVAVRGQSADDCVVDSDPLLRETLTAFRDWINQGKLRIGTERELTLLGKLLYRLLFGTNGSKAKMLMYAELREAKKSGRRISIQLAFKGSQAELASLPWEFLYDEQRGSFFATTNDVILSRFVSGMDKRGDLVPNELPLRMLIVVSKKGGRTVAAQDVIKAIKEFAGQHPGRIVLEEPLIDPSLLQLQDHLEVEANHPHIIHFIGHGRYNKAKRQGEIALSKTDESDDADWVDQAQFKNMFTNAGCIPKLVFLQLCEGAVLDSGELIASFEGLAPALIVANMQAVVAMQFPIKNVHAGKISTKFYDELTKYKSVGEAVQAARRMVSTIDPVAAGTPVLYMYGYDGAIVAKQGAERTPGEARGSHLSQSATAPESSMPQDGWSAAEKSKGVATELPVAHPPPDESSAVLIKLMDIGNQRIFALVPGVGAQGLQVRETPVEAISLSWKLHSEVIPALRGRDMLDMQQHLADLCKGEVGTPFGEVLKALFEGLLLLRTP
jgi:hypothetical protein